MTGVPYEKRGRETPQKEDRVKKPKWSMAVGQGGQRLASYIGIHGKDSQGLLANARSWKTQRRILPHRFWRLQV